LFPLRDIIIFWAIVFLLLAFGFSVNDVFDTKEDNFHLEKENLLVSKKISFPKGLAFSVFLGISGLGLSLFFSWKIFIFCLAAFLLGFFYSAPPIRFKGRPFLDLISHGLFAGALIFFFPILVFNQELEFFYYLIGFSFFYLSVMAELRNHLEDYETDKKAGLKTVVAVLKYQISKGLLDFLAIFFLLILLPVFLSISLEIFFFFLILSFLFLFLFLSKRDYKNLGNYRIMDIYVVFSFLLILITVP